MCLSPEFFDGREALVRRREAEGDFELDGFLEGRHGRIDELYALGMLKDDRIGCCTTDLYMHKVTRRGRRYLDRSDDYQLIFVRRDVAVAFAAFLDRAAQQRIS